MSNLTEVLADVVERTLPFEPPGIKITGSRELPTVFEAVDSQEECQITMRAITRTPIPNLVGKFGLPGYALKSLKASLAQDTEAVMVGADTTTPKVKFAMPDGATSYPLMTDNLPKHLSAKDGALKWGIDIRQPSKTVVDSFTECVKLLPKKDRYFKIRTDGGKLKFVFDVGEITTESTFAVNVKTQINPPAFWGGPTFLKILKMAVKEKSSVKITNQGVIGVFIYTPAVKYEFLLPGFKL
jgi:hypothetical protein